jgi:excisionase family DNA binding protein
MTGGDAKLDRVVRLSEVAELLGICARSVRRLIDRGELPGLVRVGRSVGLMQSDVETYLDRVRRRRSGQ